MGVPQGFLHFLVVEAHVGRDVDVAIDQMVIGEAVWTKLACGVAVDERNRTTHCTVGPWRTGPIKCC